MKFVGQGIQNLETPTAQTDRQTQTYTQRRDRMHYYMPHTYILDDPKNRKYVLSNSVINETGKIISLIAIPNAAWTKMHEFFC